MNRMIGVVGGMGSYAGIDLIRKIYDQTNVSGDRDHLPVAMLSLPQAVTDRTDFLSGRIKQNPGEGIADMVNSLAELGANVIGIACNTAHAEPIFSCIRKHLISSKPFKLLNMVEEVGLDLGASFPDIKKVGVLSTFGTLRANIYPNILAKFGIEVVQVSEEIQERFVHPAVYDSQFGIKAKSNPVCEKAKSFILEAASYLAERDIQAIILGCTEIPLALNESKIDNLPVIDSTKVLARALIKNVNPEKLSH